MTEQLCERIARAERGEIIAISRPTDLVGFVNGLLSFGVDGTIIKLEEIDQMGEAGFVEVLNDVRLDDNVLVVYDIEYEQDRAALHRARFNIEHALTNLGGRAVFVVN